MPKVACPADWVQGSLLLSRHQYAHRSWPYRLRQCAGRTQYLYFPLPNRPITAFTDPVSESFASLPSVL